MRPFHTRRQVTGKLASMFFMCLATTAPVQADAIYTKSGDILSGQLISFQDGLCLFKTRYGVPIGVQANDLAGLSTDERHRITFANGDIASGRLLHTPGGSTVLESGSVGRAEIASDSITAMIRLFDDKKRDGAENVKAPEPRIGNDSSQQAPLDFLAGSTVLLGPCNTSRPVPATR